jgi:hypothetical protein
MGDPSDWSICLETHIMPRVFKTSPSELTSIAASADAAVEGLVVRAEMACL